MMTYQWKELIFILLVLIQVVLSYLEEDLFLFRIILCFRRFFSRF